MLSSESVALTTIHAQPAPAFTVIILSNIVPRGQAVVCCIGCSQCMCRGAVACDALHGDYNSYVSCLYIVTSSYKTFCVSSYMFLARDLVPQMADRKQSPPHAEYDVVIVGAGLAGLSCAAQLRAQSPHLRLLVLEASDRVGGRLYSPDVHGHRVDLGGVSLRFALSGDCRVCVSVVALTAIPLNQASACLSGVHRPRPEPRDPPLPPAGPAQSARVRARAQRAAGARQDAQL